MKTCIAGNGADSTSAVLVWLAAGNDFTIATLFLLGEQDDPLALWLTDWESPLVWPVWGTFLPAVITRGSVTSKVGLDSESLEIKWTPATSTYTASVATANPYQLASIGHYDNLKVRVWTVYMPTPGDANTLGCSELFGGRVADTTIERGVITFSVNSLLDVVNQQVPNNIIELLNTAAAYAGATPPHDTSGNIPRFNVMTGNSNNTVMGDCVTSGYTHHVFGNNDFRGGFLVFDTTPTSTLGGVWSAISQNTGLYIGADGNPTSIPHGTTKYNQFVLYTPLPWPPTPGADTFYVSAASPINQADGDYFGFPYVPDPTAAA